MVKRGSRPPITVDAVEREQFAALCWRMHRGKIEVLLITSRDTGRWVTPKGWPMAGHAPHAAAEIEAWQEAGVTGKISQQDIGIFRYEKLMRPQHAVLCSVRLFPLRVTNVAEKFPERKERRRKWFAAETAAKKVIEPELRRLLAGLTREVLISTKADALAAQ